MTIIQAYRRTKPYTHQFVGEAPLFFKPNEQGDIVCDVPDEHSVERLLATPTGFRVYPFAAAEEVPQEPTAPVLSPVLTPTGQPEHVKPESGNSSSPAEEPAPGEEKPSDPPTEDQPALDAHPHVLRDGEQVFDLRPLSDADLRAFAKANNIQVSKKATGDTIRDAIVAALQPKA